MSHSIPIQPYGPTTLEYGSPKLEECELESSCDPDTDLTPNELNQKKQEHVEGLYKLSQQLDDILQLKLGSLYPEEQATIKNKLVEIASLLKNLTIYEDLALLKWINYQTELNQKITSLYENCKPHLELTPEQLANKKLLFKYIWKYTNKNLIAKMESADSLSPQEKEKIRLEMHAKKTLHYSGSSRLECDKLIAKQTTEVINLKNQYVQSFSSSTIRTENI